MKKELINYENTDSILSDVSNIIKQAQNIAYRSVNVVLLERNWLLGKRIAEEELKETRQENYGKEIIINLSKQLTAKYGKGFETRNLYRFVQFYKMYPEILPSLMTQSFLSWTHYTVLLNIFNKDAREWYEKEAIAGSWSVRTLQNNVYTQAYDRVLLTHNKELVEKDLISKVDPEKEKRLEFVKNPVILDFLGIADTTNYTESDIEKAIITHIQSFLLEMGKGYCFVGRQARIHTEKHDYFIDLVFFNYILNCFVLVDIKKGRITHQDVGQMDMYVRMFDELIKEPTHNPTLGMVLCDETDEDIARYSILKGNEQLFATKYKMCLPAEEELKAEIESQKTMYYLQHKRKK